MLFNCALEYAIRKVKVNQDGLKLNSAHQILVNADDVNIGRKRSYYIKKAQAWIVASKETGLEVNGDKTKYMVTSRDRLIIGVVLLKVWNSSNIWEKI